MTSRCKTTGKVSYTSKGKADAAISKLVQMKQGEFRDRGHAYRCEHSGHWHIGSHDGGDAGLADALDVGSRPARWTFAEWEVATMELWARCRDFCEWCGKPLGGQMERHHRQPRAVGGDRLANLMALHPRCHQWVTEHPEEARGRGAIVSRHAPDPAAVTLTLPDTREVLLDDDGHYSAA